MANKIDRDFNEMKRSASSAADYSKNKLEQGVNKMKREGKEMASDFMHGAYEMGERTKEAMCRAEDMAKDGLEHLHGQVKAHPFMTIGISFLVGMLIGKLNK